MADDSVRRKRPKYYRFRILSCLYIFLSVSVKPSLSTTSTNSEGETISSKHITEIISESATHPQITTTPTPADEYLESCPSLTECSVLGGDCIDCNFTMSCVYGKETTAMCRPKAGIECTGEQEFEKTFVCRYCYQTESWEHDCTPATNCKVNASPRQTVTVNCTVLGEIICLGRRTFFKRMPCNWTSGYRYTTALILSITLGGFGVDRFYLGYWREGLGKLFSFGGLGVWTIVDAILVGIGYITPADGSLYIF